MANIASRTQRSTFRQSATATEVLSHKLRPIALMALLALASAFIVATPARADSYPVCLAGGDNELRCEYASLEQCHAAATGGLGYCVTNAAYTSRPYASDGAVGKHRH